MNDVEAQRRAGWQAVWDSGLLTADPYTNATIWRCVMAALNGALGPEPDAETLYRNLACSTEDCPNDPEPDEGYCYGCLHEL